MAGVAYVEQLLMSCVQNASNVAQVKSASELGRAFLILSCAGRRRDVFHWYPSRHTGRHYSRSVHRLENRLSFC
jgi:hypothetical protein